jgi:hypothetical protein
MAPWAGQQSTGTPGGVRRHQQNRTSPCRCPKSQTIASWAALARTAGGRPRRLPAVTLCQKGLSQNIYGCFRCTRASGPPGPGRDRPKTSDFLTTATIRSLPRIPTGRREGARTARSPGSSLEQLFSDLWMWLQLTWLPFEVVRRPVGVFWGRFGTGLGFQKAPSRPQSDPKRPRPDFGQPQIAAT